MSKLISKKRIFAILAIFVVLVLAMGMTMRTDAAESEGSNGVIEVYLMAGQSNAVGYGEVSEFTGTDSRFTNGFDNVLYYGEGEHWDGEDDKPPLEFVPTTVGLGQNPSRVGAEIGIASALGDSGKMNAIIKCAWGGTSIYNSTAETSLKRGTWTSPTYIAKHNISTEGNKCGRLYTWFLETVTRGLDMLKADGYTPVIKGIWWMQGEAETGSEKPAAAYNELLTTLINDMRADLTDITGIDQSALPFVMGEITRNPTATQPSHLNVVCQAQLDVAAALNNVFVVDTTGLAQQDAWHYTADSQVIIGERFVETVLAASGDIPTAYGVVPKENIYAEDGVTKLALAMFQNGKYLASYSDWNTAMSAAKNIITGKAEDAAKVEVVLIDNFTAGKYDNTSQMGGTLVIDLNGYTLTTGTSDHMLNGIGKRYNTNNKMCDTNIIFENGNISMSKKVLTSFGIWSQYYAAEKTFSYTFNNVNFSFNTASASVLIAGSANSTSDTDASKLMYVDMEFNNCVFDLSTNAASGANLFRFGEKLGNVIQTVRINGGRIIKATCAKGSLYTIGSNDTVTFGKYNGHYTEIELPSGVKPASESFTATDTSVLGSLVFAKTGSETVGGVEKDIYELTCLKTKYGDIPSTLASVADYPFVLFKFNNGTLESVSGYAKLMGVNTNDGAFHYAKEYVKTNEWNAESGYAGQKTAVIYQRCDYTTLAGEVYENMAQTRGEVTYDLNGYKLSQNQTKATSIFKFGTKPWGSDGMADGHADVFPTTFNIINGSIEIYSASVMTLQMSPSGSAGYTINDKTYTINYNNITFSLANGATANNMFFTYWAGKTNDNDPTPLAPYFINFNDCTFDLEKNVPAKGFKLFNIAPIATNYICNTVTVNGGVIKSKYWDGYITLYNNGTSGSTCTFGKSAITGEYTALTLPNTVEYPSYLNVINGKDGKILTLTLIKTEGIRKTYILGESVDTKYCVVPHRYSDANVFPYVVIVYDKNENITQIEGFKQLIGTNNTGAFNFAKNGIKENVWDSVSGYDGQMTAVILARRDYTLAANESFANIAQIRGEVTLDLDGYTLSQASTANANPLFYVTSKPWETVFPSTINIINGKMLTYNGSMFKLNMWTGTSTDGMDKKLFTFNLENLTLGLCEGATATDFLVSYGTSKIESAWVGNEKISPYFFNLKDCVIDLETVKPTSSINIFNISTDVANGNYMSNNINVYGCEFKADSLENINFVTEGNNGSSLTFNKADGGNYSSLTLNTKEAPSITFNGGKLEFVKIFETADSVTYRLRPVEVSQIDYAPKMSITLDGQLVMNVYIPANYTQKFTFNGETYEDLNAIADKKVTIDGKDYYRMTVALGSAEAAKDIKLAATVTVGENTAVATFTFSIPKYARKVLANGTDVEKTLAKDVLAYVKAAYSYFTEFNTAEEIARVSTLIDSIIGDYKAEPVSSGETNTVSPVTSVTLNLDSKPSIRFYVTDTTIEFFANGRKLDTVTGTDETYGAYVELDVYAYVLSETITYGEGGSYHISDFIKGAVGTEYETLVKAFVKYTESAAAYRNSVVSK
ncbi:MAG: sialate O-acetylesterase [Ruminococcaceae bacterium]|nr:sialate O-acetylesterase [Oscillospiraceae bacterium]